MMTIHKEVGLDMEWNKKIIKSYYDKKRVETFSLREGDGVGQSEKKISISRQKGFHRN
jgi:hypothetical protein